MENEAQGTIGDVLAGNRSMKFNIEIDVMSIIYLSAGLFVAIGLGIAAGFALRKKAQ